MANMAAIIQTVVLGGLNKVILLYCLLGSFGARCDDDDDVDDDVDGDDKYDGKYTFIGMSVTYGVLLLAFTIIAGLFSLGAFIFFGCKKWIRRKLGIQPAEITERGQFINETAKYHNDQKPIFSVDLLPFFTSRQSNKSHPKIRPSLSSLAGVLPLNWVKSIRPDPTIACYGFGTSSDGITITNQYSILRHRPGKNESDGARWSHGFTSGKHVFEVVWPKLQRGVYAQIGVGTLRAPLNCSRATSLVGMTEHSWGLDIVRRRVIHQGEIRSICPAQVGVFVPERFLMYVDLDSGKLGFGTDEVFWGVVACELNQPGVYPLYIMVGMTQENSHAQVIYRGSAVSSDIAEATSKDAEVFLQEPPSYESLDPEDAPGVVIEPPTRIPESPPPPYKG